MNKNVTVFTISLATLATAIALVAGRLAQPSFLWLILAAVFVATWLVYFYIQKTKHEDFIRNYLLTIVVKLLAGGIFVSILIYLDRDGAETNAIFFMTTYFLCTGLEVGFLFRRLR